MFARVGLLRDTSHTLGNVLLLDEGNQRRGVSDGVEVHDFAAVELALLVGEALRARQIDEREAGGDHQRCQQQRERRAVHLFARGRVDLLDRNGNFVFQLRVTAMGGSLGIVEAKPPAHVLQKARATPGARLQVRVAGFSLPGCPLMRIIARSSNKAAALTACGVSRARSSACLRSRASHCSSIPWSRASRPGCRSHSKSRRSAHSGRALD